jgi:hypothetical protein
VLRRDKATFSANLDASETQHSSELQLEILPSSTNEIIKVVDYELLKTDPGIRPPISNYHSNINFRIMLEMFNVTQNLQS